MVETKYFCDMCGKEKSWINYQSFVLNSFIVKVELERGSDGEKMLCRECMKRIVNEDNSK